MKQGFKISKETTLQCTQDLHPTCGSHTALSPKNEWGKRFQKRGWGKAQKQALSPQYCTVQYSTVGALQNLLGKRFLNLLQ